MKRVATYCLLFVSVCLIAGTSTYLAIRAVTKNPGNVVMPTLVEKDLTYVLETLTGLGLNTKLQETRYSSDIPRNHVLTQFPEPGTLIRKGRDVMIRISKGNRELAIPDLGHLSQHRAGLLLENTGLALGTVSRTFSDTSARDTVITQYPAPGIVVDSGSRVDILVSRGPRIWDLVMPDLDGMGLVEAETRLSALNLAMGTLDTGQTNVRPENTVMAQSPLPGTRVPQGSRVDLTINRKTASRPLTADDLEGVTEVAFSLEPGFLNRHVRIEAELFGTTLDLWEGYSPPGQKISVLIPRQATTDIRIFVDGLLIKTQRLTPWTDPL